MIGDEVIQAALIAKLKSLGVITALVPSVEIRELQWQGNDFSHPNIRLDLEENHYEYDEQERCQLQYTEFSIYVYSQERSSKQASQIKTVIMTALIGLGFTGTGVKFSRLRLVDNVPAVREDDKTWRTQIRLGSRITQA